MLIIAPYRYRERDTLSGLRNRNVKTGYFSLKCIRDQ